MVHSGRPHPFSCITYGLPSTSLCLSLFHCFVYLGLRSLRSSSSFLFLPFSFCSLSLSVLLFSPLPHSSVLFLSLSRFVKSSLCLSYPASFSLPPSYPLSLPHSFLPMRIRTLHSSLCVVSLPLYGCMCHRPYCTPAAVFASSIRPPFARFLFRVSSVSSCQPPHLVAASRRKSPVCLLRCLSSSLDLASSRMLHRVLYRNEQGTTAI